MLRALSSLARTRSAMANTNDAPLDDIDHNSDDAGRSTQSIQGETRRQNDYMNWACERWARAVSDAADQSHRSYVRRVEASQHNGGNGKVC